ncbi:DUF16 domain-containing protein [Mycoplasmoides pneumoniae]
MFKRNLKKDKIKTSKAWIEDLPDGSYDMGFYGNLNHMEKRKSGYVTQKQFNDFKNSNNQRLIKIENTLVSQGEQISQLIKVSILQGEQINKLTETVEKQGEQIQPQGETLKLILETLQVINKRLDRLESK